MLHPKLLVEPDPCDPFDTSYGLREKLERLLHSGSAYYNDIEQDIEDENDILAERGGMPDGDGNGSRGGFEFECEFEYEFPGARGSGDNLLETNRKHHTERDFSSLNEAQHRAVQHEGLTLIYAGAGTGKTHTLCHRVIHLVQNRFLPAPSILAITFTNKAAEDLKKKLSRVFWNLGSLFPDFRTFLLFILLRLTGYGCITKLLVFKIVRQS